MSSSDEPLRVGLAGAGAMGRRHAEVIQAGEPARLVAVADPDTAAARAIAEIGGEIQIFSHLDQMLADAALDVVHVCSPPRLHFAQARASLQSGCHVYVEKPFTETHEETVQLVDLATTSNLKICAGHQLKFVFPIQELEERMKGLGSVHHVESHFHFRPSSSKGHRLRADEQLKDILPHPLYLLLHFLDLASDGSGRPELEGLTVGPEATVHALVRRGALTGTLHVTLHGRPVDSYVRLVGTGGELTLDYVREGIYGQPDRGGSAIGKILNPISLALQLTSAALRAGLRHGLGRGEAYPGLAASIGAFHEAIRTDAEPPVPTDELLATAQIADAVSARLASSAPEDPAHLDPERAPVLVTGGTGFLGHPTVKALVERGHPVRVISRRGPPPWRRLGGVEYVQADLGTEVPREAFSGARLVLHAAAATSGGWDAHRASSIGATENVLRTAAQAGITDVIYVSSLAVVGPRTPGSDLSEDAPLIESPKQAGPYVWGKAEAEKTATKLAEELGLEVKIVRPGAVIDEQDFEAPGRLGRRVGPFFFAVGAPTERLGVVGRQFAADVLRYCCVNFDDAPDVLHLLSPELPTRRQLLDRLRAADPSVRIVRIPHWALRVMGPVASLAQRVLRPGQPIISLADVFRSTSHDTSKIARLAESAGLETSATQARSSRTLPSNA